MAHYLTSTTTTLQQGCKPMLQPHKLLQTHTTTISSSPISFFTLQQQPPRYRRNTEVVVVESNGSVCTSLHQHVKGAEHNNLADQVGERSFTAGDALHSCREQLNNAKHNHDASNNGI